MTKTFGITSRNRFEHRRAQCLVSGKPHIGSALHQAAWEREGFSVTPQVCYEWRGEVCLNLEVILTGRAASEALVVGAHYDTVPGSPGANDNASGVAALLELARLLKDREIARTLQ